MRSTVAVLGAAGWGGGSSQTPALESSGSDSVRHASWNDAADPIGFAKTAAAGQICMAHFSLRGVLDRQNMDWG